ncbi:MAG: kelch repeat-containing protein [Parachlamydiaceae bacterium]
MQVKCSAFFRQCLFFVFSLMYGLGAHAEDEWTDLTSSTKPSFRYSAAMAYRLNVNDVILFGGAVGGQIGGVNPSKVYDDMWRGTYVNGQYNWEDLTPNKKPTYGGHWPSPRYASAAASNLVNDDILMYGGHNQSSVSSTTYLLTKANEWWTISANVPSKRYFANMVYFGTSKGGSGSFNGQPIFILFGGQKNEDVYFNEVWALSYYWNGAAKSYSTLWVKLPVQNSPAIPDPRAEMSMVNHPDGKEGFNVVVFGGKTGQASNTATNQLWVMKPSIIYYPSSTVSSVEWKEVTPLASPSPRYGQSMTYDSLLRQFVMYGGYDSSGNVLGDTWILHYDSNLDLYSWENINSSLSPPLLGLASMVYDRKSQFSLLFGGQTSGGGSLNLTYGFNVPAKTVEIVGAKRIEVTSQARIKRPRKACYDLIKVRVAIGLPLVVQFKAFRNAALTKLDQEIPNDQPIAEFKIPVRNCSKPGRYWITAVDAEGHETAATFVKIKAKRKNAHFPNKHADCGCF